MIRTRLITLSIIIGVIGAIASTIASFGSLSYIWYMLKHSDMIFGMTGLLDNLASVSVSLLGNSLTIFIFLGLFFRNQILGSDEYIT